MSLRNSQIETLAQSQVQVQTLSPQQVLEAKVLELSTIEIEERIRAELCDNPALEEGDKSETGDEPAPEESNEFQNELSDELRSSSDDFFDEDDIPDFYQPGRKGASMAEIPYSDSVSFFDLLREQLHEENLTSTEEKIGEYLIGCMDNNGFLDKAPDSVACDLAIYQYIDVSEEDILKVLHIIQGFDPPGIGARDLQESLLIQIARREVMPHREIARRVIKECFDEFAKKRKDKIAARLHITEGEVAEVFAELQTLNPKPGSSLGEAAGRSRQQITPDFIVESFDGEITFSLNNYNIPELHVSKEYSNMLTATIESGSRSQQQAALYIKQKLDSAKGFIDAVRQRERTLTATMRAIISLQHDFFAEGSEEYIKPMILKDVAAMTGLDISTISRATSGKYMQTNFGTFAVKELFTDGIKREDGGEASVREVQSIMEELVNAEDKQNPLTDDTLAEMLQERGFQVARRTVAKYRDHLHIPVARLRRK